jgi:single-strand DNA-binding protein
VTWNKLAENCNQFLTKGQRVYVEGRLRTRTWDGQDGQRRTTVEVVANSVLFLDKPSAAPLPAEAPDGELEVEDLPF